MKRRVFLIPALCLVVLVVALFAIKFALAQTVTPASVEQSASRSNLQVIRYTYNPISAQSNATFEDKNTAHVVLSIFSPASSMKGVVITEYLSGVKKDSIINQKLTLSDGSTGQITLTTPNYPGQNVIFKLYEIKKGENKLEYDYVVAN